MKAGEVRRRGCAEVEGYGGCYSCAEGLAEQNNSRWRYREGCQDVGYEGDAVGYESGFCREVRSVVEG